MIYEFLISGILLLGGSGVRFGDAMPKQFQKLSGKKVYLHTLERMIRSTLFGEIVLVCHPDWISSVEKDLEAYPNQNIRIVSGGPTRQESSYNGIVACRGEYVVIHESVRPFVSDEILKANVDSVLKHDAVDTCIPSADTLVYAPHSNIIASIPKRSEFQRGQTPQSFKRSLILEAHAKTTKENSTDDCSLVLEMGRPVHVVPGCVKNIKITTTIDLFIAEQLMRTNAQELLSADKSHLAGKKYIVTGGTSGIGKAVVEILEAAGAHPISISRSAPNYPADLTNPQECKNIFSSIREEYGAVDGLINCIGLLKMGKVDALETSEITSMVQTNFLSVVESCRACALKPGGHIVNLSSSSFYRGRSDYALYSSMKAALVNFTQAYADEHPDLNINIVVPQRTSTPMRWNNFPNEDRSTLLNPTAVAETIVSLLTRTNLTGTTFEVKKRSPLLTK